MACRSESPVCLLLPGTMVLNDWPAGKRGWPGAYHAVYWLNASRPPVSCVTETDGVTA